MSPRPKRKLRQRPLAIRLPHPRELRQWARDHGYEVADRARIPQNIEEDYLAWAIEKAKRKERAER